MEKTAAVKQEALQDASKAAATPAQAKGKAPQTFSLAETAASLKGNPIILIQPKNEGMQQQRIVVSSASTIQAVSPLKGVSTIGQSTPLVLCGSPLKLTPMQAQRILTSTAVGKSPEQGKATSNANFTLYHVQPLTTVAKQPMVPRTGNSPSKVVPIQLQKMIPITSSLVTKAPVALTTHPTMAASAQQSATAVRHIAPKMNITPVLAGQAVSLPTTRVRNVVTAEQQQLALKTNQAQGSGVQIQPQRVLMPALASNMSQLSSVTSNIQFPHGIISGGVVYLPQQALSSGAFPIAVPIQANALNSSGSQVALSVNGNSVEASPPARPRKPCNCTKSQCLKLYCDCFANGEFCSNCNCATCFNNMDHERERSKAIKACLERNPQAFHPKIGKGKVGESERRHNKGCHCKRSGCLKNYCECYEAKILCTSLCKCTGCKNFEESPERKTLMHLADAAEVRVKQQNAAKTILESQIEDLPTRPMLNSGERLPFSFVTEDIVQATCQCLLAQAVEAEKGGKTPAMAEKMLIQEFGRCLLRIIHTANKTKEE